MITIKEVQRENETPNSFRARKIVEAHAEYQKWLHIARKASDKEEQRKVDEYA